MGTTADKIAGKIASQLKSNVVSLSGHRAVRQVFEEARLDADRLKDLISEGRDPCHAIYIFAQNFASVLGEQLSEMKETLQFVKIVSNAEDKYQPGGPPLSPLTISYFTIIVARPAAPQIFFWAPVSINIEKRCNHYRLIVACMLSGSSRDRPVIVGWSTALRGQVINESLGQLPKKLAAGPRLLARTQIITQRVGDETRWTTARSLGEVGASSVHSKPVFVCSDCTFRPGLLE